MDWSGGGTVTGFSGGGGVGSPGTGGSLVLNVAPSWVLTGVVTSAGSART